MSRLAGRTLLHLSVTSICYMGLGQGSYDWEAFGFLFNGTVPVGARTLRTRMPTPYVNYAVTVQSHLCSPIFPVRILLTRALLTRALLIGALMQ